MLSIIINQPQYTHFLAFLVVFLTAFFFGATFLVTFLVTFLATFLTAVFFTALVTFFGAALAIELNFD